LVGRTFVAKKERTKVTPVYEIKLVPQSESSRWRVIIKVLGVSAPPMETLHPSEWVARNWAEKIATSWEMDSKEWVVADDSL
jgi:hypothetical protein